MWRSIHYIALGYPDNPSPEVRASYKEFFMRFGEVIPCKTCAVNYTRHLQELPIDEYLGGALSGTKDPLFVWSVHLHNTVNAENGKPILSLDQAYRMYTSNTPPPCQGGPNADMITTLALAAASFSSTV